MGQGTWLPGGLHRAQRLAPGLSRTRPVLERMHEPDKAIEIYRRGLSGTGGPNPVPLPRDIGRTKVNRPMLDESRRLRPRMGPHWLTQASSAECRTDGFRYPGWRRNRLRNQNESGCICASGMPAARQASRPA